LNILFIKGWLIILSDKSLNLWAQWTILTEQLLADSSSRIGMSYVVTSGLRRALEFVQIVLNEYQSPMNKGTKMKKEQQDRYGDILRADLVKSNAHFGEK
jgi:hypothetical protein